MESEKYNLKVYEVLKKALKTLSRKAIAEESGVTYANLSQFLQRKTASVKTLDALSNVLTAHGYMPGGDSAREATPPYRFQSATEEVIAADLRAAADVVASALPVSIKTDKLHALESHLPAYIEALEGAPPQKKHNARR